MRKPLYIFGAGGLGREAAFLAETLNEIHSLWELKGFLVEDKALVGTLSGRHPVAGWDGDLPEGEWDAVLAFGSPALRMKMAAILSRRPGVGFPNLIHPSVLFDRNSCMLGVGNIIQAGTLMTTDIEIASFVDINVGVTIGHDTSIHDCAVLMNGCRISGSCEIGEGALIGASATVLQGLSIGKNAVVGAGAVVVEDVLSGQTVAGVPAKPLKGGEK